MRGIDIADIQRGVKEIIEQTEEINFDDLPTLFNEQATKAMRTKSMAVWQVFYPFEDFLCAEVFLQVFHATTLQETLYVVTYSIEVI